MIEWIKNIMSFVIGDYCDWTHLVIAESTQAKSKLRQPLYH